MENKLTEGAMRGGEKPESPKPAGAPPAPTNVYEGKPDERQASAVDAPVSRFRPTYRALNPDEKALHDAIKDTAGALEGLINQIPTSGADYHADAIKSLELSVMWAVKQLTANR